MDIVDFLTARYDEDEALAKAATPGPWAVGGELLAPYLPRDFVHAPHYRPEGFSQGQHVGDASVADGGMGPWAVSVRGSGFPFANARHIAAHDPARVLADIAAKRRLLELAGNLRAAAANLPALFPEIGPALLGSIAMDTIGTAALIEKTLAAVDAEHPDYDPAWRIDAD